MSDIHTPNSSPYPNPEMRGDWGPETTPTGLSKVVADFVAMIRSKLSK